MKFNKCLWMLLFVLLVPSGGQTAENAHNTPLMIQEQGSFAAGGIVLENPGTFNPQKPVDPAGQSFHGDHAYVFYAGSTSKCNTRCLTISVFQKGCIGGFEPQALSWPPV